MAAGNWTVFDSAKKYIADGTINIATDTIKVALFTSTAAFTSASITTYSTTNEVAGTNGYTQGGVAVLTAAGVAAVTFSGSTTKYGPTAANASWTASGGSIVARYALLYANVTRNTIVNPVIGFVLLDTTPADVTTTTGNQLVVNTPANGFFTLA